MALVDFHCHLDLFPDHVRAVRACEAAGIYTLTVTTTPKAWPRNRDLTAGMRYVRAALGLHPQVVAERSHELALWDTYLAEARYIGEVGLDAGPRFHSSLPAQRDVFRHVLTRCAGAGGKVLTVHSVRAARAVLDMIEEFLPQDRGRVVLHWFTGSGAEAERAVRLGCYLSVNERMLETAKGQETVRRVPLDRLLTETDGPFTTTDGRPSEPRDVERVLSALARVRGHPPEEVAEAVHRNLASLLRSVQAD